MSRYVTQASWNDAPHLTEKMKQDFESKIPRHQQLARTAGIPHIGTGAIYPIPDEEITCAPFPIPADWPIIAGGDISKTNNAFVWLAHNRDADIVYCFRDYLRADLDIDVNAMNFKKFGAWVPLEADAADIRSDQDRRQYVQILKDDHEIDVELPDKFFWTGIERVWQRMQSGRLFIFTSCQTLLTEKRMYRRNKKGEVVKEKDHCLDSLRYAIGALARARTKVLGKDEVEDPTPGTIAGRHGIRQNGWMG